ncbi:MAG: NAD(P)H-dependent oxidoreductase subunit E [Desulfofustis sp. PB-SRB1]|jgi:NADH-quinone oxidoreductase E subunit|nr:NAD(P)H-dependent oxidoreductase subunit E [Desulfofustis sp. PB-SRB1]MBM1002220.1 NAD(P)H-dependent oxidoreductase subunit E [Desulfofustis sp. PB-SRB1]HBH28840.1 NAD(P)H-dependent oxidoreductase subunit E [Desulfofustis sp.]
MSDRSQLLDAGRPFAFDETREAEFTRLEPRYPERDSLIMPALWLVQEQQGWISREAMEYVAERTGAYHAQVFELATFYTMYHLRPPGKHHICICRTLSCYLREKQLLVDWLAANLDLVPGAVTEDGRFSLEEVECLGHCGSAPVVQVDGVFYEDMDEEKLGALIEDLRSEAI